MPQPIMNPNYFNPQYRTPMYGQFMPQQEQFQPQQFMQQPQQNAVQMYGRIVPAQECIAPNEVPMDGNTAFFPKGRRSMLNPGEQMGKSIQGSTSLF